MKDVQDVHEGYHVAGIHVEGVFLDEELKEVDTAILPIDVTKSNNRVEGGEGTFT